jgi:hypothetical protein
MCGIVGVMSRYANGLSLSQVDTFQEMLFVDQLRGRHGTGMFWDTKKKKSNIIKGPIPSHEFLACDNVQKAFKEIFQEASFIVGHNRHATRGAHTFENTHPFRENHITLIHNGTLHTHKHMKDVEVDSHAICHSMGEIGEIPTIEKLDGAFALVWFNSKDKTLNFIRNSERPLHLIETLGGWFFSSELGLAEWILKRNKLSISKSEMIETGLLYTYSVYDHTLTTAQVKIKEPYDYYFKGNNKWEAKNQDYSRSTIDYTAPSAGPLVVAPEIKKGESSVGVDFKLGQMVTFSPIQIHVSNTTYYLEGLCDTPLNTPDIYVKVFNGNKTYLEGLLDHPTLRGEVTQIYSDPKDKNISLRLKNITMALYPTEGTDLPDSDPYVTNIMQGVH